MPFLVFFVENCGLCDSRRQSKWLILMTRYSQCLKKRYVSIEICYRFLYAYYLIQTATKKSVNKLAGKSAQHMLRKCIRKLKITATTWNINTSRIQEFQEKLASIEKIILYFSIIATSLAEWDLLHFIFIIDDVACDKEDVKRIWILCNGSYVNCFYLCQAYAKIPKHNMIMICWSLQNDTNQKHVQQIPICFTRISVNVMSQLLGTKVKWNQAFDCAV